MKYNISYAGEDGFVRYNNKNKEVMVTHPNANVRSMVRHYLTTKGRFTTSLDTAEGSTGSRVLLELLPNDNQEHMDMAMSELHARTGISVNWGYEPEDEPESTVIKSLYGDEDYEIIN